MPDLLTTVAAFIGVMRASSQLGFELSGVIATSAVVTAVIGLSLQDTLGNALGGLALQLDSSIRVGDWVKMGDVSGRVSEIHWRYTAIETRSWETVIVPNSILMRSQVTVLGRRTGQPEQWRRAVNFHVDFRWSPNDVIDAVERALRAQALPNVGVPRRCPTAFAVEFRREPNKVRAALLAHRHLGRRAHRQPGAKPHLLRALTRSDGAGDPGADGVRDRRRSGNGTRRSAPSSRRAASPRSDASSCLPSSRAKSTPCWADQLEARPRSRAGR